MSQPSYPPAHHPSSSAIVGPQFCVPHPTDLAILTKVSGGKYAVADVNGNIIFNIKDASWSFHGRRLLLDAAGNPILTMLPKRMSAHNTWTVFRGDSKDPRDMLFTVRRSSLFQLKIKLHVFLANSTKKEVCDFMVQGNFSKRSCVVYAGDTCSTIVAQINKEQSAQTVLPGKFKFKVTVHPNIDHAFIVTLFGDLDGIYNGGDGDSHGGDFNGNGVAYSSGGAYGGSFGGGCGGGSVGGGCGGGGGGCGGGGCGGGGGGGCSGGC